MAEAAFAVAYDGPALRDGAMPVRELAPALLALGDLFTEASVLLYPDRGPVALNIRATAEGSFLVQLLLESEHAWDELVDIFGSHGAAALTNLRDLVIGSGLGVFWLIKRLKGRRIAAREPGATPGTVRLTLDDQTTIEVPTDALRLFESIEIRRKARDVVAPLAREGVEQVRFSAGERPESVVVEKEDTDAFEVAEEPEEPLLDQERELIVEIAGVIFTEGNKWRFSDGQQTLHAAIEDASFLARVDSGLEAFRKGDMLRCRMRIMQTRRASGGLHTEYTVVEVIEHIPRHTQLSFEG